MASTSRSSYREKWLLPALLFAGFALRAFLAVSTEGYPYDTNTFLAWAQHMASQGPSGFYSPGYFADYPPGYMLVLWGVGSLVRMLGVAIHSRTALFLLTLVPILCDLALAALLYRMAVPRLGRRGGLLVFCLVLFSPMLIFDCAVWKQVDSVLSLILLLCFFALQGKQYLSAGIFYAAALLIKPQALLFGPVFATCYLLPFCFGENAKQRGQALKNAFLSLICCLGVLAVFALLFQGEQEPLRWLLKKYTTTAVSYPYASINAFNLFALLGGNWAPQDAVPFLLSWKQWGFVGILVITVVTGWFAVVSYRRNPKQFSPFLLGAFYCCGIFILAHNMHERYLFPAVLFLFAAFALLRDRRLLALAVCFSFSALANVATIYLHVSGSDEFLTTASSKLIVFIISLAQVLLFCWLCYVCYQICIRGQVSPMQNTPRPASRWTELCDTKQPRWNRFDAIAVALLTAVATLLGVCYLGNTRAPQSGLHTTEEAQFTVQFSAPAEVKRALLFPGIGSGKCTVATPEGLPLYAFELSQGSCFSWQIAEEASLSAAAGQQLTVTLSGGLTLNELAFQDTAGNTVPVTVADGKTEFAPLFDEPGSAPARPSQLDSMYFDEIYHGRTAYEMLHGLDVYETTHPPLGKDFILLGIALFGMNTLGWRIMGALFGAAMVPVFYLLTRRLLRRREWAAFAASLFLFDFMRFTQSRIATIDVFVVFFILLATYFMVAAMQTMLAEGTRTALKYIAGSGIAFGFACGSKWTGIYAGAGLCVLYFGTLIARYWLLCETAEKEDARKRFGQDFSTAIWAGLAFFVVIPLFIYIASYLPYFLRPDTNFGLRDFWNCQLSMFRYHSGLTATHPFQSSWYSWPVLWRPVWYYMGTGLPQGTYASIAVLGNPLVWWGGLAGIVWLLVRTVRGGQRAEGTVVLISFAAQLLPWVLVTRAVFLYHYFACVPFIILALTMLLMRCEAAHPRTVQRLRYLLPAAAVLLFCFFYPVLAGVPVPYGWAAALKWLPSWGFYIL